MRTHILLLIAVFALVASAPHASPPALSHTVFEDTAEVGPPAIYTRYLEAIFLANEGKLDDALEILLSIVGADPEAVDVHVRIAAILMERKEYARAIEHARTAVDLDPEDEKNLQLLARAYMAGGRRSEAIARLEELVPGSEHPGTIHYLLSMLLEPGGDRDRVIHEMEDAVEASPENPFYLYRLGEQYLENGRMEDAEDVLKRAIELAGNDRPILFLLGRIYLTQERWDEAVETLEELAGRGYRPRRVHTALADAYVRLDRLEDALRHMQILVEIDPSELNFRAEMANLYIALGREEEGIDELRMLWKTVPDNLWAARRLVNLYIERDSFLRAESVIRSVLADDPEQAWAWVRLSYVCFRLDRRAQSVSALETALRLEPDEPDLLFLLGNTYRAMGMNERALDLITRAYDRELRSPELLYRKGVLEDLTGDQQKAIRTLGELIRLDPEHAPGLNYLGYLFADHGIRLDEAESLILRALRIEPASPFYLDSLGWVYYRQNRFEDAVRELEKSSRMMLDNRIIMEHLADAYAKAGRPVEAESIYRSLMESEPEDAGLREKLRLLGEER